MVRVFLYVRSQGTSTTWKTWWGFFFTWDLKALIPRGRHGEGFSLNEISRLFYHVAVKWGLKALLPRGRHCEGFSLCEISWLFYHVADMARVFLHVRSLGSSTTWQTWWGFFFRWDLKALLPRGRHGEGISFREISRLFHQVADMVRVFRYVISQVSSTTWQTWWGFFFIWDRKARGITWWGYSVRKTCKIFLPQPFLSVEYHVARHGEHLSFLSFKGLLPHGRRNEPLFSLTFIGLLLHGRRGEPIPSYEQISLLLWHCCINDYFLFISCLRWWYRTHGSRSSFWPRRQSLERRGSPPASGSASTAPQQRMHAALSNRLEEQIFWTKNNKFQI